jgi:hypothetical protein
MKTTLLATAHRLASSTACTAPRALAALSLMLWAAAVVAGTPDSGSLDRAALARAAARTVPVAQPAAAPQAPGVAATPNANDIRKQDLRNAFSAKSAGETRHLSAQERAQLRQQLRQDLRAQRTDDSGTVKR